MGQDFTKSQTDEQLKERGELLKLTLTSKLAYYQNKILKTEGLGENKKLPIMSIKRLDSYYTFDVEQQTTGSLKSAVDSLFGADWKKAIREGAQTIFYGLLGSSDHEDKEVQDYFVYLDSASLIRVDFYLYKTHTSRSGGVTSYASNGVCGIMVESYVDISDLELETIVALIGEQRNQQSYEWKSYEKALDAHLKEIQDTKGEPKSFLAIVKLYPQFTVDPSLDLFSDQTTNLKLFQKFYNIEKDYISAQLKQIEERSTQKILQDWTKQYDAVFDFQLELLKVKVK